ncbi:tetratricopeptide repeat protein [Thermodesulfobacteriota bacterium]
MTEERAKRKLSAIFSADVKGYSRLMGDDELATVETLKKCREIMGTLIRQYQGRVVDSPGDNLLAEFGSAVDAVECAVKVQEGLKAENSELSENRRMEFRIGVNLGDVLEDGERIYGDGVNIAARIEGLADGGGVCVSGTVYDQVKNKTSLGYEYLGEHTAKNISDKVRVYRVLMKPESAGATVYKHRRDTPGHRRKGAIIALLILVVALALFAAWYFYLQPVKQKEQSMTVPSRPPSVSDKPSIAVLPFTNMSGDATQDYFSDGISENIITGLSKIPRILVIARNSSFTYKGKAMKIRDIGQDLGVQYVLEGSVQKSGDKVRVTAQLIDAATEKHLWAERYDRNLKDIFTLQDEITMEIVKALHMKLTGQERVRVAAKGTSNLEAYLKLLQGTEAFNHQGQGHVEKARKLAKEVITLDPEYTGGYTLLARTYLRDLRRGMSKNPDEDLESAHQLAQKVLDMDPTDIYGHMVLGQVYFRGNQLDKAIEELEKAVALNPNSADVVNTLGGMQLWMGKPQEAIALFQKGMRLDPVHAGKSYNRLARAYIYLGKYKEAEKILKKLIGNNPERVGLRLDLAACYAALDKHDEAKAEVYEIYKSRPQFSLQTYAKGLLYKDAAQKEKYLDLLRKAGLK